MTKPELVFTTVGYNLTNLKRSHVIELELVLTRYIDTYPDSPLSSRLKAVRDALHKR